MSFAQVGGFRLYLDGGGVGPDPERPSRSRLAASGGPTAVPDLHQLLAGIARTAARVCEANDALVQLVEGDQLRFVAHHGRLRTVRPIGALRPAFDRTPGGQAMRTGRAVHVRDVSAVAASRYPDIVEINRVVGARTALVMPVLRGREPVGLITIRRKRVKPFTPKQIALLRTFADHAATAIDKARLADELAARNTALSEALEQQTATGHVLEVISSSPTNVGPAMEALVQSAVTLCRAQNAQIFRVEGGDTMRLMSRSGPVPASLEVGEAARSAAGRSSAGRSWNDGSSRCRTSWRSRTSTRTSPSASAARASAPRSGCRCFARASPSGGCPCTAPRCGRTAIASSRC